MDENQKKVPKQFHKISRKAKEIIFIVAALIAIPALFISYRSYRKVEVEKEIAIAEATIACGFKCRDELEYRDSLGYSVPDSALYHCYELVDAGISKLEKISEDSQGQDAIIYLINFYKNHNKGANYGAYDNIIKRLETILKNSQKKYYDPK